jgi:nucleoside-diphosphate-sugar epimerase
MKVLVLGGAGFVGAAISRRLAGAPDIQVVVASRNARIGGNIEHVSLDATDSASVGEALSETDAVVNCITGTARTITESAANIASCTARGKRPMTIIHMSSMAVYGDLQGSVDESTRLPSSGNWYASAKREAERLLQTTASDGASLTMLRIGCVFGPASPLWVDRIGMLLRRRRLGDIGVHGDGWSNLVHVNDIAEAVLLRLQNPEDGTSIYNLTAPDSPRWNEYFRDFALATDCVPLKYRTRASMLTESYLFAPIGKGLELLLRRLRLTRDRVTVIPPSLLRLWAQQIKLDSTLIEQELGLTWTSYEEALADSTGYFRNEYGK